MVRLLFMLTYLLITCSPIFAQFTLDAQYRPRFEFRNGYRTLPEEGTDPASFVSQRTRLSAGYEHKKIVSKLSLQDVRVWGDEEQLRDVPSIALHEAWAEVRFSEAIGLRLGRQELIYDDHRLLGSVNWTQQARSHDAAVFKVKGSNWAFDAGGAYNQASQRILENTYNLNNYKVLSFLWGQHELGNNGNVSLTAVMDGYETTTTADTGINYRFTYGGQADYSFGNFSIHGTGYLQNGESPNGQTKMAYMGAVDVDWTQEKWSVAAGYEYLSGTSSADVADNVNGAFHTLYATNHKFYGHMDYFLSIPADTRGGGLQDAFVKAGINLNKQLKAAITGHYFALAKDVQSPSATETISGGLGAEIDASLSYKLNDMVTFKSGYSLMLPTEDMEALKGVDEPAGAHWGWVMVNVTPQLLKKKVEQ